MQVFLYVFLNRNLESFSVNKPQVRVLFSLDGCRSDTRVKQSQFTETISRRNLSFDLFIDFHNHFSIMQYKETAGFIMLLHEVISFSNSTELKLFN
jgi:hypothetical protein